MSFVYGKRTEDVKSNRREPPPTRCPATKIPCQPAVCGIQIAIRRKTIVASLGFDFYGVKILIVCDDREIRDRVLEDFRYFSLSDDSVSDQRSHHLLIHAYRRPPDYEALPPIRATIYSPRNICYSNGDTTYIDYFGGALSVYSRRQRSLVIYSDRLHLLHEVIFLTVLSRVCEELERKGMHRVHALAVERNGVCALFLLPSGGGKTTLGLEILKQAAPYRLVSEDSPLITRSGRILPFPLRIGIVAKEKPDVAPEHLNYLERMEFEPKYLISLKAFEGKIAKGVFCPRLIFLGERTLAPGCTIRKGGRIRGFKALVRHMIVGVGLYQGVEFLLQTSITDLLRYVGLFCSRLVAGLAMLRQSRVFVVDLGRNPGNNIAAILSFLDSQGFGVNGKHPNN
jgi:hypothetical protein